MPLPPLSNVLIAVPVATDVRLLPPTVRPAQLDTSSTQHSEQLSQADARTAARLALSTIQPMLQAEGADAITLPALLAKSPSTLACPAMEASTFRTAHVSAPAAVDTTSAISHAKPAQVTAPLATPPLALFAHPLCISIKMSASARAPPLQPAPSRAEAIFATAADQDALLAWTPTTASPARLGFTRRSTRPIESASTLAAVAILRITLNAELHARLVLYKVEQTALLLLITPRPSSPRSPLLRPLDSSRSPTRSDSPCSPSPPSSPNLGSPTLSCRLGSVRSEESSRSWPG